MASLCPSVRLIALLCAGTLAISGVAAGWLSPASGAAHLSEAPALAAPVSGALAPATSANARATVTANAANYGIARGYHMGVAVLDTQTGQFYGAGDFRGSFASESVVKAFIATRLLVMGQMHGHIAALAYKMITQSDDAIATALYGRVGGDSLVNWIRNHYRVWNLGPGPRVPGWWGNNHITPQGMVYFYAKVKRDPVVGPWLMNAMHHATKYGSDGTYQFFGLPSATSGAAIKQGWGCDFDDLCTTQSDYNSTGYVNGDRYTVAILARGPLADYGSRISAMLTGSARALLPGGVFPPSAPTVLGLSTRQGSRAGGFMVAVSGSDFVQVRAVFFGGAPASSVIVLSPTRLHATAPAHTSGPVWVRVVTAYGTSTGHVNDLFHFGPPPVVSAAAPALGSPAGGTPVTVTGANFVGVSSVRFGGVDAPSFRVVSPTQIRATSPVHGAGVVDVSVSTGFGPSLMQVPDEFRYVAPPVVGTVSPALGGRAGGTVVTVTGANFLGVTALRFGTVDAPSFSVVSPTQIRVSAPAHTVGIVDVVVVSAYGTSAAVAADKFSYS